jgi:hypothetical protein
VVKQQKPISTAIQAGENKVKEPADLMSGEDNLSGLHTAVF